MISGMPVARRPFLIDPGSRCRDAGMYRPLAASRAQGRLSGPAPVLFSIEIPCDRRRRYANEACLRHAVDVLSAYRALKRRAIARRSLRDLRSIGFPHNERRVVQANPTNYESPALASEAFVFAPKARLPIRKRPFGALLLAFARTPIGPLRSFDSGAKYAPSRRMTISTCRPCRRRGRRASRELPSFPESPQPAPQWSASTRQSIRHSAARCARPWSDRARPP